MSQGPMLTDLILHQQSHTLEIAFDNDERFHLPWEYLRVFSPSKEVRAKHGEGRILVTGKEEVKITDLKPIGNYAIKIFFDDGHNSGLYDWPFLYELGKNHEHYWADHLKRVAAEDPPKTV